MICNNCFLYNTLECEFIRQNIEEIESLDGMECNQCTDYISLKDKKREEKAKKLLNKNKIK